jgi:secreted trypsin-like serine protease
MQRKMKYLVLVIASFMVMISMAADTPAAQRQKPQKKAQRIIGGVVAKPGAWPWMVALVSSGETNNYYAQFCGGALIAPNWVATAAHCVDMPPFEVLVGVDDLNETGTRIKVKNVYVHPGYYNSTGLFVADIALLELETNASQTPIPLYEGTGDLEGVTSTVIGWGAMDPDGSNYAHDLMQVAVPIVSQQACNTAYDGIISDYEVCAGYDGGEKDSCAGDSGGPLMIQEDGVWKLAGIVSWGEGCAMPGYYGVYARISAVREWINEIMSPAIAGDYNKNKKLGLEDVIGILNKLTTPEVLNLHP